LTLPAEWTVALGAAVEAVAAEHGISQAVLLEVR